VRSHVSAVDCCLRVAIRALCRCLHALQLFATAHVFLSAVSVFGQTADRQQPVIIHAVRIDQPLRIDGKLDEETYNVVQPITAFVQQLPNPGAPATERTEAWVLFDNENIYISCRCWTQRPDRIVANDVRRDSANITSHDHFAVGFDTLYDGRNGYQFSISAAGGMRDGLITDEVFSADWNGVWDGKATRFEGGWIAEYAIPFKTLRYAPGREQKWHLQFRRLVTAKSEWTNLTPLNPNWGVSGWNRFSLAATLVDLEAPPEGHNFEVKPYAIARVTTDHTVRSKIDNDFEPDGGFDLKYGLTKSLTADFTYNTDFAQVEADEQQVNLTRFALSFPEKREFFLEGQGTFLFGTGGGGDVGGSMVPAIFYSRRIGLAGSREVPVIAGGRLNGKAGPWSLGALSIETGANDAAKVDRTNFTVLRLRRNIFRRSNVGGLYTRRSLSTIASGANDVWGIDANFAFRTNVYLSGYVAKSRTEGRDGDDLSYRAQFNYTHDRYGISFDRLAVQPNFNPEIGLLRRQNFRRNFAGARFSPRTVDNPIVRKWTYEASIDYITDNYNTLETRDANLDFRVDLHNSDSFAMNYEREYELLTQPFQISRFARIPAGGYQFHNFKVSYDAGAQHRLSGTTTFATGTFYDGEKKTASFRGRMKVAPQLSLEPNLSFNWIDLHGGSFTDRLAGARAIYTMTPRMFIAALVQYSSSNSSLSTNLRFRWEYRPGSELFVVYSEGRSTLPPHGTDLDSRGLAIKINRLFRF
jgi:uncharacterized protein DUF5916